jgi:hypothetical protein
MHVGAFVPVGIFMGVASAAAVRLLLLWRRTRALPELAIGAGLGCMAFVGLPLSAVGRIPALVTTPLGRWSFAVAMFANAFGLFLIYVFTWSVFRRNALWARTLLGCVATLLLGFASGASMANLDGENLGAIMRRALPHNMGIIAMTAVAFLWTGIESGVYYRAARLRTSVGLADPVVTNRFLLWAIGSWTSALLCGGLLVAAWRGMVIAADPIALYGIALAGVVMTSSWYLAFFSPVGYRRWIEGRAGRIQADWVEGGVE